MTVLLMKACATVLGGVILWMLKSIVQAAVKLRDDVHDIMTNHIPHLQQAVEELKEAIRELSSKLS